MRFAGGTVVGQYSFGSRFESGQGMNPEELLGAAHAGCFSMALSSGLAKAGYPPDRVHTYADVHLEQKDGDWGITRIHLRTQAKVLGIAETKFQEIAGQAKTNCPVSKALGSIQITLDAKLEG
jgi:osmotically inducible protein OsmC